MQILHIPVGIINFMISWQREVVVFLKTKTKQCHIKKHQILTNQQSLSALLDGFFSTKM